MDEPLSSLDIGRKREIVPLLERLPEASSACRCSMSRTTSTRSRLASNMLRKAGERRVGRVEDVLERLDLDDLGGRGRRRHVRVEAGHRGAARLTEQRCVPIALRRKAAVADRIRRSRRAAARSSASGTCWKRGSCVRRGRPINVDVLLEVDGQHFTIADHARRARARSCQAGPCSR
jgi:hypothetical protein